MNKANVRFIIHHSIPSSADDYWQACGRAGNHVVFIKVATFYVRVILIKHVFSGRDGLPAHCYLYYRRADTTNVKRIIEWGKNVDVRVIQGKLSSLSELDRILTSNFCRRRAVLGLLDEFTNEQCSESDIPCDNCRRGLMPDLREVSYEVFSVLTFLKDCEGIDVMGLRHILAGLFHSFRHCNLDSIEGLLKSWHELEIAQFTDYLLFNKLIEKHCYLSNETPIHFLKLTYDGVQFLSQVQELHCPVFRVKEIEVFKRTHDWRCNRNRIHNIQKKRFFPKKHKKNSSHNDQNT